MHPYDEVTIELSRLERECLARAEAKIRAGQLGEAWMNLVDDRGAIEGGERLAA